MTVYLTPSLSYPTELQTCFAIGYCLISSCNQNSSRLDIGLAYPLRMPVCLFVFLEEYTGLQVDGPAQEDALSLSTAQICLQY